MGDTMLINTPISLGELVDKISILIIKKKNISDSIKLQHVNKELEYLSQQIIKLRKARKPTLPTELSLELLCNPFLRTDKEEIANKFDCKKDNPLEVFIKLRKLKDSF